ncbi:50S ribosomal protein L32 [Desulfallas thermosapovorans]|uniref:Large ribosomal subunit protein bL32 n=1 Tax=Desulfallas thermosapovorans DSM 6562 TaxID=1121431 RepID=A0A5S4ZWM0_9FIRM|nr:50S ribosomal protein L32 [Desulfallas thermosapovorans]TYO97407.1 LSU ribosomal protein L32P [Desulfallas thermosapovorans DSM 6562]
MGVPKRKSSKQRKRQRRANWKIEAPELIKCPQCHELVVPHRVCPDCGYYKGREAVAVK